MSSLRSSLRRYELVSKALIRISKSILSLIWLSLALPKCSHHDTLLDEFAHVFIAMGIRSLKISIKTISSLSEIFWGIVILRVHLFVSLHFCVVPTASKLVLLTAHYVLSNVDETRRLDQPWIVCLRVYLLSSALNVLVEVLRRGHRVLHIDEVVIEVLERPHPLNLSTLEILVRYVPAMTLLTITLLHHCSLPVICPSSVTFSFIKLIWLTVLIFVVNLLLRENRITLLISIVIFPLLDVEEGCGGLC